ncbi:MAG: acyl-CoA thioesterase domain-containing protein [Acidimicrobiia bacterium]
MEETEEPLEPLTLSELLDLKEDEADCFLAITPAEGPPRLFGGQVAAQSLRAATLTVEDDRFVHSLHSYFVRPGRPGVPLRLVVERIRNGRSFSTRRVTAMQHDEAIFVLEASFHVTEDGFDWHLPAPKPEFGPDEAKPRDMFGGHNRKFRSRASMMFDIRPLYPAEDFAIHPAWVRVAEPFGDDPAMHACGLTYVSDMAIVRAAIAPGAPLSWGGASLDHAVWFHRPVRVDDWLLFSAEPVTNFGARGLAKGTFHNADGVLVASIAQECLLRSTGAPPPP